MKRTTQVSPLGTPLLKVIAVQKGTNFIEDRFFVTFFCSSDEEFDRPIREYVEKAMSQSTTSKGRSSTKQSDTFEKEMEDELDQIYHNFISRGTFELPITSKEIELKRFVVHCSLL